MYDLFVKLLIPMCKYDTIYIEYKKELNIMAQSNKKKKKKKHTLGIIIIIVLIMMILFATSFFIFFKMLGGSIMNNMTITPAPTIISTPSTIAPITTSVPTTTHHNDNIRRQDDDRYDDDHDDDPHDDDRYDDRYEEDSYDDDYDNINNDRNGYVFPTDSKVISTSELNNMSRQEIKLMYYEIYARHGMTFYDDDLIEYFESKNWYMPSESDKDIVLDMMSDTERKNLDTIEQYQRSKGWRQ